MLILLILRLLLLRRLRGPILRLGSSGRLSRPLRLFVLSVGVRGRRNVLPLFPGRLAGLLLGPDRFGTPLRALRLFQVASAGPAEPGSGFHLGTAIWAGDHC